MIEKSEKSLLKKQFNYMFMEKCLNFNETWQILLHTFLSDSEMDLTSVTFVLPFAPEHQATSSGFSKVTIFPLWYIFCPNNTGGNQKRQGSKVPKFCPQLAQDSEERSSVIMSEEAGIKRHCQLGSR